MKLNHLAGRVALAKAGDVYALHDLAVRRFPCFSKTSGSPKNQSSPDWTKFFKSAAHKSQSSPISPPKAAIAK
jgi:hypothetical protein